MYLEKNLEKKWLIKSENKILGPFSFEQIVDLLRKKQISVIDEVRDPETRWLYVRENNEFKNIVEEIRNEIDARQESTKTYQSAVGSASYTNTNAQGSPSINDVEEVTLHKTKTDILIPLENKNDKKSIKEAEVVTETTSASASTNTPHYESPLQRAEKPKIYGLNTDAAVQSKITNYSLKLKVSLVVLVVLVVSSVLGYLYIQKRTIVKKEEDLIVSIKKMKYTGLLDKAAESYLSLPDQSKVALLPSLLDMYPVLQKVAGVTQDDIKGLKANTNLTAEQRSNIELIGFWLAAKQLNYGQAQEFLTRALSLQPTSFLIKENDAWLTLKSNQAKKAYDAFKSLFDKEKNGRYLYGMSLAYMALQPNDKLQHTKELFQFIERYTFVYFNLKKELLLMQMNLARELGDDEIFQISVKQFLNTPTQLAAQFTKPGLLLPDIFKWSELETIIANVQPKLGGDQLILFQLHILLENGQLTSASDFLKLNQSKMLDPQAKAQLNLLLLNAQNRSKDILALGQTKTLDDKNELNAFLLGMHQIQVDPKKNLYDKTSLLDTREYVFYKEWLELEQIMAKNTLVELKNYLAEHFVTIDNFIPVFEAKGMIN